MPRLRLPQWLRRALEAALIGAGIAIVSLAGDFLPSDVPLVLPTGLAGLFVFAPAVLALAVVCPAYPVAMAATRGDAVLGATAAFLIAADVATIVTGRPVALSALGIQMPAGLFATMLAVGPAIVGLAAAQIASPLGFGRRAGGWAAGASAVASLVVLGVLGLVV